MLRASDASLRRLADRFGTPLYVHDVERVRSCVGRFTSAFSGVPLFVSDAGKANGSLALLNRIGALGVGADVVYLGELRRVERAGTLAGRGILSGVGTTERELEAAIRAAIHTSHAASEAEVDLLSRPAGRLGLRLTPDVHSPTPFAYTRSGHAATKLAIPVREAEALYTARSDDPNLRFVGFWIHIGSQIAEVAPILRSSTRCSASSTGSSGVGFRSSTWTSAGDSTRKRTARWTSRLSRPASSRRSGAGGSVWFSSPAAHSSARRAFSSPASPVRSVSMRHTTS